MDSGSDMASSDLDILLRNFVARAQQEITATGAFYPFAAVIDSAGKGKTVEFEGGAPNPAPDDISQQLTDVLKIKIATGKIRAAGMCASMMISPPGGSSPTEAIAVFLEDIDGDALELYLPYKKADDAVQYSDWITIPAMPRFFGASPN